MVRPMVHSQKHYVQWSISSVTGGLLTTEIIADAVDVSVKNAATEVENGCSIKAVFVELWIKAGEASNSGSFVIGIYKLPGTGVSFTFAQAASMHTSENKKNVFYMTQGLMNTPAGSATNVFRGWIKIPKSKQRFGLGDRLQLFISAAATIDLDYCGFATYKEYS